MKLVSSQNYHANRSLGNDEILKLLWYNYTIITRLRDSRDNIIDNFILLYS